MRRRVELKWQGGVGPGGACGWTRVIKRRCRATCGPEAGLFLFPGRRGIACVKLTRWQGRSVASVLSCHASVGLLESRPDLRWISLSLDGMVVAHGEEEAAEAGKDPVWRREGNLVAKAGSGLARPPGFLGIVPRRDSACARDCGPARTRASASPATPPTRASLIGPGQSNGTICRAPISMGIRILAA
jgi:hypothetical protein